MCLLIDRLTHSTQKNTVTKAETNSEISLFYHILHVSWRNNFIDENIVQFKCSMFINSSTDEF